MYELMAAGAALSFAIGGIFMQLSDGLSNPIPSLLVYLMFAIGASIQALAMRQSTMGVTYIIVLGLEAVLAILFGILFFKEGYSFLKLIGVVLVTAGFILLRSGEH